MPITIYNPITVTNPSIFRHGEDLDKSIDASRFLVHDSMEDVLDLSGVFWIKIAQLCSVMSVYWIQEKIGAIPFRSLSKSRQEEIAAVVVKNNSPLDQFNWARNELKYHQTDDKSEVLKLTAGSKVLMYTPRHVSAAVVTSDLKWRVYDPETASAEEYTVANAGTLYLDYSTSFLHGK